MIVGVHEDIAVSELVQKYPGVRATRPFVGGVLSTSTDIRPKVSNVCSSSWNAGLIPFVSFKTDPYGTSTGRYDTRLTELARYLAGKPDTRVIWYHEPEDNMSGKTFMAAFNRARDVMKYTFPDLQVGYAAMAYQWRPGRSSTKYPHQWRVQADFYSIDAYSGNTEPFTSILPEHDGFARWHAELVMKTTGARFNWGVTERGWEGTDDQLRADQIRRETRWLADAATTTTGPQFYLYWNSDGTEGDPTLINGPRATEALRDLVTTLGTHSL